MNNKIFATFAASSIAIAALTGCTAGSGAGAPSLSAAPAANKAPSYAQKAEKALAKEKFDDAVAYAELAVAAMPNDAGYRALLGKSYLAAGRFTSAERSYADAVELGDGSASTVLSLAMTHLGQGDANRALTLIRSNRSVLPASDYGLGLALAGDAAGGVDVLVDAIRGNNMSPRTRQNLALAYALNGQWKEAKLMAMQDIDPSVVDARIMEWAKIARPGAYQERVASLLDVQPVLNDPGQPVRLALSQPQPEVMASVSTEFAPAPEPVEMAAAPMGELAAIGPAPRARTIPSAQEKDVVVETADVPASTVAPIIKAAVEPARVAAQDAAMSVEKPAEKPMRVEGEEKRKPVASVALAPPKPYVRKVAYTPTADESAATVDGTVHLVQLGAFSSPENAQRAWGILTKRHSELSDFQYASSRVNVKGKTLYRLAAFGFGNGDSAKAMCSGIKAKGGACIVRQTKRVMPTEMAQRQGKQLASR